MRVLIIEDNERLAESIQDILKQIWYDSDICTDGITGYQFLMEGSYDAVVLDVMLPGKDGITLLKEAREKGNTVPVLMLTAKSEVEDKVLGLETGADYYLTKPFDKEELLAVIKAIVRRKGELLTEELNFGGLSLNQKDFTVSGSGKTIQLGRKEYDILHLLMTNPNMVIPKETILRKVWGEDGEAVDNNVEIYISFLRKKLAFLKVQASIVTIRNLGYRLCEK